MMRGLPGVVIMGMVVTTVNNTVSNLGNRVTRRRFSLPFSPPCSPYGGATLSCVGGGNYGGDAAIHSA